MLMAILPGFRKDLADMKAVVSLAAIPLSSVKSGLTTHPPTKKRLERADRAASKYPIPVIDFDSPERGVSQRFVFR
jgi:hypothetical protein